MTAEIDWSKEAEFAEIWEHAKAYTMTSPERGFALYQSVNALVRNDIPGSIVECGVWKGGSAMIIALTLLKRQSLRPIFLFDTFEGMTEPGDEDVDFQGHGALELMEGSLGSEVAELVKAEASLEMVKEALASTGYPKNLIEFVKGDIRKTLAKTNTLRIALLRLDTDFYDSTLSGLQQLWPRLAPKGIFIVDDYGHWQGARKAFHDYFEDPENTYDPPLLWRIDYTGYGGVKLQDKEDVSIERYDYIPDGFETPDLLPIFPYAQPKDPWAVNWEYLRCETPHIWRSDSRDDKPWQTGNVSVEEAACLYTIAKQFSGKQALEIGSHFGWTSAHILAAGTHLNCIDPEFNSPGRREQVTDALNKVDTTGSFKLWGGFSPDMVAEVSKAAKAPWSFVLIDGSHDGDAPRNDALAVLPYLANDAVVIFHDMTSPFVERGLYALRQAGMKTKLFNTMQVLGVAWRGSVEIPKHVADPNVSKFLPLHLEKYEV